MLHVLERYKNKAGMSECEADPFFFFFFTFAKGWFRELCEFCARLLQNGASKRRQKETF